MAREGHPAYSGWRCSHLPISTQDVSSPSEVVPRLREPAGKYVDRDYEGGEPMQSVRLSAVLAAVALGGAACSLLGNSGPFPPSPEPTGVPVAYVANFGSGTVTPIDTATNKAEPPIKVGNGPFDVAITPNGETAYVTDKLDGTVTPIDLATGTTGTPIKVGLLPFAIAITPNGKTAYVADFGSGTVTPIDLATDTAEAPIKVGLFPLGIAVDPNGSVVYVTNFGGSSLLPPFYPGTVTPISTATNTAGKPIPVGLAPYAVTFAPNGETAYVTTLGSGTLVPIDVATSKPGTPIPVGLGPDGVAVSPDGSLALVANSFSDSVSFVDLATDKTTATVNVGPNPEGIVFTPDGSTAYVSLFDITDLTGNSSVVPVDVSSRSVGTPIPVGHNPENMAITG